MSDFITLNAQGLDEGIRCAMCTNSMANDRGCDGGCVVDTAIYERVLKVIKECTVPEREKRGYIKEADLDDTILRLNNDGWEITSNERKLISNVIYEMPMYSFPERESEDK